MTTRTRATKMTHGERYLLWKQIEAEREVLEKSRESLADLANRYGKQLGFNVSRNAVSEGIKHHEIKRENANAPRGNAYYQKRLTAFEGKLESQADQITELELKIEQLQSDLAKLVSNLTRTSEESSHSPVQGNGSSTSF